MKRFIARKILANRLYLLVLAHLLLLAFCYGVAFWVRFDAYVPSDMERVFWATVPWILGVKLNIFYLSGNYHGWWRHITFSDLVVLLRATTLSTLIITAIDHFVLAPDPIPRSILLLDWSMTVLLLGGLRSVWRLSREQFWPMVQRGDCRRALIVGADQSGVALANQIQAQPGLRYRIVGFLDSDPDKNGSRLGGIPVLGAPDHAAQICTLYEAKEILVQAGSLPGSALRGLMQRCKEAGRSLKVIPAIGDLLNGHGRLQIRDLDINDLLHREPVELDSGALESLLKNHSVMVTGAGGSIGCEMCRQVLRFNPKALVMVERAENNLFAIEQQLQPLKKHVQIYTCIADVLDKRRMGQIFQHYRPEAIFHAAAHKHVPMMEANPSEAIKNNVFGTKRLADLAHQHGAKTFVLISTDKAVNPSSVMGASKQIAERYIHAFSQVSTTKFIVVRFGNVLGSTGSVVPIFQEQIRRGGPITITHPEMERFFMTIPEASQLVLQAAAMGRGGEIFVLDMGQPMKIMDLAQDLIRLSGLSSEEIEVKITGPRPGEKLFEELYLEEEQTLPTPHPKLRVAYHRPFSVEEVRTTLAQLWRVVRQPPDVIRKKLMDLVPEYSPPTLPHEAKLPLRTMNGNGHKVKAGHSS